jgi:hypothetical protein
MSLPATPPPTRKSAPGAGAAGFLCEDITFRKAPNAPLPQRDNFISFL